MEVGNNSPAAGNFHGGDRQQFCVSWSSHQSNMHSAFPKLLSSEKFVDVTLACDGGSIKCHKVVLSACSDYLERLLLEIPCSHPIIFLRDMQMWELQALVDFMYRGEVYVEQQQLSKLMQAAKALQVRGLSSQGRDNNQSESPVTQTSTSTPSSPSKSQTPNFIKNDESLINDTNTSSFLDSPATVTPATINNATVTATSNNPPAANTSNFMNIEHTEALQHLEKALSACEATLTETSGMVKMEPDEPFTPQQDKPYSISMVPTSTFGSNCNTPNSPLPAIEGYQRPQRRSEAELKEACDMVALGMTFEVASKKYNIPISTIRFYMIRKGMLKKKNNN